MNVQNCSRCGGDHTELPLIKLEQPFAPPECAPIEWTHFALCPSNGHPIMVMITKDGADVSQETVPSGTQKFEDALPIVYRVFQERREAIGEPEGFASTVREFFGKWKPV